MFRENSANSHKFEDYISISFFQNKIGTKLKMYIRLQLKIKIHTLFKKIKKHDEKMLAQSSIYKIKLSPFFSIQMLRTRAIRFALIDDPAVREFLILLSFCLMVRIVDSFKPRIFSINPALSSYQKSLFYYLRQ